MGYIKLYNVFFTPPATGNQTVRVEYRPASTPTGTFVLANNAAPILANGDFNPIVTITGLVDGATYTVKVTNLCNGSVATANFVAGQACTSYTVQAGVGGSQVNWVDCQTGADMSVFLIGGAQDTFCSRTGVTSSGVGEITLISTNGAC